MRAATHSLQYWSALCPHQIRSLATALWFGLTATPLATTPPLTGLIPIPLISQRLSLLLQQVLLPLLVLPLPWIQVHLQRLPMRAATHSLQYWSVQCLHQISYTHLTLPTSDL